MKKINITIKWVKAHNNFLGNDIADEEAKKGTDKPNTCGIGYSKNKLKQNIREHFDHLWIHRVQRLESCRQTKLMMPRPNYPKSKEIIQQDRHTISLLTQFITGHAHLNRHNWIIDKENAKLCRLCENGEESPIHILTDCEPLWRQRQEIFGRSFLDPNRPIWEVKQLIEFLKIDKVKRLFDNVVIEDNLTQNRE